MTTQNGSFENRSFNGYKCPCSEITSSYIYMLMECGNLDLNRWLQKRTAVNPLERKLYWKNMLEAVQTIHKHGCESITS